MASEKILQAKQQYVDELAAKLEKAAGGVIVDYRGITVADDTVLRKELREAGVEYFVVGCRSFQGIWINIHKRH